MKYTVAWTPEALAELAQVWMVTDDKAGVTAGSRTIDLTLAENPFAPRFELTNGSGTVIHVPFGVDFRVDVADRMVTITSAWLVDEDLG
jgi:hypothetical protein